MVPGVLLLGVLADFVTFRTISIRSAFILLGMHAVLAGFAIAFVHFYDDEKIQEHTVSRYVRLIAPFVMQFSFGALLSASLVFYWFSGTVSVSWPILTIVAVLIAANDVFREYYLKPFIQFSVYFFAIFSTLTLILPFLFNTIDVWAFVLSGILALVFITLFVAWLSRSLQHISWERGRIATGVISVFLTMNALYFLNIIPPIPLSIREAGVFHNVERSGATYVLTTEEESLLEKLLPGQTIHIRPGDPVYVFTSIFAPAELDATIVHHWQVYDEEMKAWLTSSRLSFSISGGRESGYRGYSFKTQTQPGLWRVNVETERGQVLGQVRFFIEYVDELPALKREQK